MKIRAHAGGIVIAVIVRVVVVDTVVVITVSVVVIAVVVAVGVDVGDAEGSAVLEAFGRVSVRLEDALEVLDVVDGVAEDLDLGQPLRRVRASPPLQLRESLVHFAQSTPLAQRRGFASGGGGGGGCGGGGGVARIKWREEGYGDEVGRKQWRCFFSKISDKSVM